MNRSARKIPHDCGGFLFHPNDTLVSVVYFLLGCDLRVAAGGTRMLVSNELLEALLKALLELAALVKALIELARAGAGT